METRRLPEAETGHDAWSAFRRGLAWTAYSAWHATAYVATRCAYASADESRIDELRGRALARWCESLGPLAIKAGQILGSRGDIWRPTTAAHAVRLQDKVRALSGADALNAIDAAYEGAAARVFERVDPIPIGAGAIAQIHAGRLHDGRMVAIKVLRPRMRAELDRDLRILSFAARCLARARALRAVPIEAGVKHVAFAMRRQVDLAAECDSQMRLREALSRQNGVLVPEPFPHLSSASVLVMELVPDCVRLDRCLDRDVARAAVRSGLRALYSMLFEIGTVHCDMHMGNTPIYGSRLVLLDFGIVATLDPPARVAFRDFFLGLAFGDGLQCARILSETSLHRTAEFDADRFTDAVVQLTTMYSRRPARSFGVTTFVGDLFDCMRRNGVVGSPDFIMALVALVTYEGTVRTVDPDLDFQAEASPFAASALLECARWN